MKNYQIQTRKHSLKKISLEESKTSKRFHWNLITLCNLKCEYCYSRAAEQQWNKITSSETIKNVIKNLKKVKGIKEVFLLGGEPTKHPKYFDVLNELYKIDDIKVLGNISNGVYKDYREIIDNHKVFKDKFYWNITFHPSQVKDIENFKNTILYIKNSGFVINVNLLLNTKFKNEINDMFEFCNVNTIPIYPSFLFDGPVIIEFTDYDWLNEINTKYKPPKELFYDLDNFNDLDTYMLGLNNFKGWKCINNSFVIPVNENKFKQFCTNIEFNAEDILDGNTEVICNLDCCVCPSRLGDEKFRNIT